jgi:hypothetical protein
LGAEEGLVATLFGFFGGFVVQLGQNSLKSLVFLGRLA